MQKKEYYKHNLPHFQQPGQAYFVTWSLKDAMPKHALQNFANKLEILRSQIKTGLADSDQPFNMKLRIGICETHIEKLKNEYNLLR